MQRGGRCDLRKFLPLLRESLRYNPGIICEHEPEALVPFPPENCFALTAASVRSYAPSGSGVYGIFNAIQWIYVGECLDIQRRLLSHISDTEAGIKRYGPTGFSFELQPEASRAARRDVLSAELAAQCVELFR